MYLGCRTARQPVHTIRGGTVALSSIAIAKEFASERGLYARISARRHAHMCDLPRGANALLSFRLERARRHRAHRPAHAIRADTVALSSIANGKE